MIGRLTLMAVLAVPLLGQTSPPDAATEARPVRLQDDPYQSPHMVVQLDDTVFTSVMLFLRKS